MRGRKQINIVPPEDTTSWDLYNVPEIDNAARKIAETARKDVVKKTKSKDLPNVMWMIHTNSDGVYVEYEVR